MRAFFWTGKITLLAAAVGLMLLSSRVARSRQPQAADAHPVYLPLLVSEWQAKPGRPSWGSPIAVSPLDGSVWAVNPDAGSVSVIDSDSLEKSAEIQVGEAPWSLVIAPDGSSVYILDQAGGNLVVIDGLKRSVRAVLPVGAVPGQIALAPSGTSAFITLTNSGQVVKVDTIHLAVQAVASVASHPYALAITDNGDVEDKDEKVYVTHLQALQRPGGEPGRDDGKEALITVLNITNLAIEREIQLVPNAHGFPNLLMGISLRGQRAWIPHERSAPDLPRGLTTTVFAAVSVLDLTGEVEEIPAQLPLNDQEIFGSPVNNPVAAVPAPDGNTLYIVLAGSNLVEVVNISIPDQPRLLKFLPVGNNPRGLALSRDGRRGYVMNYLSRSISVLNMENLTWTAEIPVTSETLSPEVLRGKILFNSAVDPRLSQGSWQSCASCHPDGGTDGVTWMFPDGLRQTPPLWNSYQTLPWHWSAALDEAQDVEDTIQNIQHGLGLAPGADPLLLGTSNLGRSSDLDALAAFLETGIRIPSVDLNEDVSTGRDLFRSAGCALCHGGPSWTSSQLAGPPGTQDPDGNGMVDEVLVDVGTLNSRDVRGAPGFDPPSLLNVGLTAPYFHDGSMPDLEALLASGHPDPQGAGNGLNQQELTALVQFLRSVSPTTLPVDRPD